MAQIVDCTDLSGLEEVALLMLRLKESLGQLNNSQELTTPVVPQDESLKGGQNEPIVAMNPSHAPGTYDGTTMPHPDTAEHRDGHVMCGRPSSPQDQLGYGYKIYESSLILQGTQPQCSPSDSGISTVPSQETPENPIVPSSSVSAEHSQNQTQYTSPAHHSSQAHNYLRPQDFRYSLGARPYAESSIVPPYIPQGVPSYVPINQHQSPSATSHASIMPLRLPPISAFASGHPHYQNLSGSYEIGNPPLNRRDNGRCLQPPDSLDAVGPIRNRFWAPHHQATCPECHATFTSSGHLKRHLETHGSGRRYKCDYCSSAYSRRERLIKHVENAHGIKMTSCYSAVTP